MPLSLSFPICEVGTHTLPGPFQGCQRDLEVFYRLSDGFRKYQAGAPPTHTHKQFVKVTHCKSYDVSELERSTDTT
jgi:hypothetical protein